MSGIVLLGAGCGLNCSAIGWIEGLTVEIVRDDRRAFPDGEYQLEIGGDVEHIETIVKQSIELTCNDAGCRNVEIGATGAQYGFKMTLMLGAVGPGLRLILTRHDREGRLAGGPQRVSLRLLHEGVEVGEATLSPRYDRDELNGSGCGVATRGSATMTVIFPP